MDINVKVDIPALDRIADLVAAHLAGQPAGNAAAAAAATAPKAEPKADKPKTETKGDKPKEEPKTEETATGDETGTDDAATVDYKDVKKAILDMVAKKGRDAAVGLLKKFDATKGEEIDQARWGEFLTAAQAVLDA